ncbi:protein of unknown function [Pararobbsia alpina]
MNNLGSRHLIHIFCAESCGYLSETVFNWLMRKGFCCLHRFRVNRAFVDCLARKPWALYMPPGSLQMDGYGDHGA